MSDFIYNAYVIDYDEVKKVVPKEAQIFEEKAEKVLVFLKLAYTDGDFTMQDIFEWCVRDDMESCRIYNTLENSDFEALENDLQEVYGLLWGNKDSLICMFKEKTNVTLGMDYNYREEKSYFYLHEMDLMQLTPSGKALQDKGIVFGFEKWVEF